MQNWCIENSRSRGGSRMRIQACQFPAWIWQSQVEKLVVKLLQVFAVTDTKNILGQIKPLFGGLVMGGEPMFGVSWVWIPALYMDGHFLHIFCENCNICSKRRQGWPIFLIKSLFATITSTRKGKGMHFAAYWVGQ